MLRICITLVLCALVALSSGRRAQFHYANATLPFGAGAGHQSLYDGDESIYVFGGDDWPEVYRYSVSTDTIEGTGPWGLGDGSGAVLDGSDSICNLGGYNNGSYTSEIWRVSASSPGNRSFLGNLPYTLYDPAAVWDGREFVYLIGGLRSGSDISDDILRFSTATNTAELVAKLPNSLNYPNAIMDTANAVVYVFGGHNGETGSRTTDILRYDVNSADAVATKLNVSLFEPTGASCTIWTGTEAYVIGGSDKEGNYHKVVKFNPGLNQVERVEVDNFPAVLNVPSCTYVASLKRVYIFGGTVLPVAGERLTSSDRIMYIDLDDPSESPVMCEGDVDGTLHADPLCCKSFYRCFDQRPHLQYCADGQLYNPAEASCVDAAQLKCGVHYD